MRSPARQQSALSAPLNRILGTEGAVRLLRVLTTESVPMTAGILARRTKLERSAARRALQTLLDTGVVDARGEGRAPHYTLRTAHPLAQAITDLFQAERRGADSIVDGIAAAARSLKPPPIAIWLDGVAAEGANEPGETIVVRVVAPARELQNAVHALREKLGPLEREFDVTVEVAGATPADMKSDLRSATNPDGYLRDAHSLAGLPPAALVSSATARTTSRHAGKSVRSHADLDDRSLAVARAIAWRLKRDPTLAERALEYVERRMSKASAGERHELTEWARVLRTTSPARLRRLLVDRGERATRLRQTLPFIGVLTPEERVAVRKAASGDVGAKGRA